MRKNSTTKDTETALTVKQHTLEDGSLVLEQNLGKSLRSKLKGYALWIKGRRVVVVDYKLSKKAKQAVIDSSLNPSPDNVIQFPTNRLA
jgi:hypothetical protein